MSKYDTADEEKHITNLWADGGIGHYTRREDLYIRYFNGMSLFTTGTVVEIGPGTGEFAKLLLEQYDINQYIIIDLEKNIKDSKETLKEYNNIIYITSQEYEKVFDYDVDLVVSNCCLSETPANYREDLIERLFQKCNHAFVFDGDGQNLQFNVWLTGIFHSHFYHVLSTSTEYCKCIAISGNNK